MTKVPIVEEFSQEKHKQQIADQSTGRNIEIIARVPAEDEVYEAMKPVLC